MKIKIATFFLLFIIISRCYIYIHHRALAYSLLLFRTRNCTRAALLSQSIGIFFFFLLVLAWAVCEEVVSGSSLNDSLSICARQHKKEIHLYCLRSYGLNSNTHRPRFGAIQMHVGTNKRRRTATTTKKKTYAAFPCIFISMRSREKEKNKVCADGGGGCVR